MHFKAEKRALLRHCVALEAHLLSIYLLYLVAGSRCCILPYAILREPPPTAPPGQRKASPWKHSIPAHTATVHMAGSRSMILYFCCATRTQATTSFQTPVSHHLFPFVREFSPLPPSNSGFEDVPRQGGIALAPAASHTKT